MFGIEFGGKREKTCSEEYDKDEGEKLGTLPTM